MGLFFWRAGAEGTAKSGELKRRGSMPPPKAAAGALGGPTRPCCASAKGRWQCVGQRHQGAHNAHGLPRGGRLNRKECGREKGRAPDIVSGGIVEESYDPPEQSAAARAKRAWLFRLAD